MQTASQCEIVQPKSSLLVGSVAKNHLPTREERVLSSKIREIFFYSDATVFAYVYCMITKSKIIKETESLMKKSPIENKMEILTILREMNDEISSNLDEFLSNDTYQVKRRWI